MRRTLAVLAWLLTWTGGSAAQEINTATRAQLEQLNGIGVTMADRILAERERAPFTSWQDFERRVKGMRGARASSASIAANSFSMARADGAPRLSFRRIVSASSSRTSS